MDKKFAPLTSEEYAFLVQSIPMITILIAGSDGEIDNQELHWAEKITHFRASDIEADLHVFYEDVDHNFKETFTELIKSLPADHMEREEMLFEKMARLNPIIEKLERRLLAYKLYNSFLSFAKHVAKSSGGILRWGSIGPREKQLMELSMLEPVVNPFG